MVSTVPGQVIKRYIRFAEERLNEASKLIKFSNTRSILKKANEFLVGGLNKFI